ncbi:MAG: NAD(P)H-hydrate dehydratase [Thermoguttaceae bacterium]|nr:NAD(P)H-hydrate dehydratase [Thermoguttaceae bacterium]MBP3694352.1 NAD(P)H-hydrate dehydratase [Thermoguttaceae bacterium]
MKKLESETESRTIESLLAQLTDRPRDGHKGTFGTVLVIGGSLGMSGAAALCAMAALRTGAGLVKAAVPERIVPIVSTLGLEFTTVPLAEAPDGRISEAAEEMLFALAQNADIAAIGPGLGRSKELDRLMVRLWERLPIPAVFDADALNALSEISSRKNGKLPPHSEVRIATPHPGEFARLCPDAPARDPKLQRERALQFAKENETVMVLKGPGTLISDGMRSFRNSTGNPGMATGGSGDVLTGILAAVCAQQFRLGISPLDAVRLGVWIHGKAGDFAAAELGECSMIASDMIFRISQVLRSESTALQNEFPS